LGWYKCNIDGASNGNPGIASCGGIFRNHDANFIYAFAEPLGINASYVAELCGAMRAIEIAYQNNWSQIWIETDSSLVVSTFNQPSNPVAWQLRNRWKNAMFMMSEMHCVITHIYREGNQIADLLLIMLYPFHLLYFGMIPLCLLVNVWIGTKMGYLALDFVLLNGVLVYIPSIVITLLHLFNIFWSG
jgi:ribonuclease HI